MSLGDNKRPWHKRVSRADLGQRSHFLDQLHHMKDDGGGEADDEADVKVTECLVEVGADHHFVAPLLDKFDDPLRPLALKVEAAQEDASEGRFVCFKFFGELFANALLLLVISFPVNRIFFNRVLPPLAHLLALVYEIFGAEVDQEDHLQDDAGNVARV